MHATSRERAWREEPERALIAHEDDLIVGEFLSELTKLKRRVFALLADGRSWRAIATALVIANLVVPGLLVGSALGAYGSRTLPYLPHVPVELAGIAVGAAGWIVERDGRLTARERAIGIGVTVALLLLAATIEAYLVPHR